MSSDGRPADGLEEYSGQSHLLEIRVPAFPLHSSALVRIDNHNDMQ